ncbi:MAG: hypothetical protein Kow0096_05620 [Thiohalomonadaceae bacterium]
MKIEPPADDLGLQHLKATDRAKGRVEQVAHVERDARIASTEERHALPEESPPLPARRQEQAPPPTREPRSRQGERRSGQDRRQRQQPTPLDTRSPHERRTRQRRAEDRQTAAEHAPPGGIDELV